MKSGYVAMLGRPNVGKSTLFNALLGTYLSIVTPKPQTTRGRVLGILSDETSQIVFLDTPGLLTPKHRLHEAMRGQIDRSLREADVVLALTDVSDLAGTFDEEVRRTLNAARIPVLLAANKMDRISEAAVEKAMENIQDGVNEGVVVAISALYGDNVSLLKSMLEERLPSGPALYPPDILSEQPERFFVSELIREEMFNQLEQELPYATAVKVETFEERNKTYIQAVVFVERASQKGIVIGSGGRMLKRIGSAARAKIEEFLHRPIYLDLWVKVRPNWRKRDFDLREFGYLL